MSSSSHPANAPSAVLDPNQWQQINHAVASLSREQLTWVSGYLAGLAQVQVGDLGATATPDAGAQQTLTILYGSQTGNAKGVAEEYKSQAEAAGFAVKLTSMADYKPKQLKNESHVVIVVSTHGEGDAPDDAVELHEFVGGKKAPKLDGLKFAVLGLGDSSYEFFCQTAKDFDERLEKLGATRVLPRVDCDVDYEQDAATFISTLKEQLKDELTAKASSQVVPMPGLQRTPLSVATSQYNKKNPFTASLLESQKITGRSSVKDIRHVEISLEGSGLQYQAGDALGVWFSNDIHLVNELLELVSVKPDETVTLGEETLSVQDALIDKRELTQSYPSFVQGYLEAHPNAELQALFDDKTALREYLADKQIIEIVRAYPAAITAQQLVDALRPITPRLYSIASSQAEVEDEVHLTVALVEYETEGQSYQGGASGFLAKRLEEGGDVKVFVESNANFRLPESPDTPVIMIGPGTGIAPFRAFMQEREAQEANGKNWLFFGNPNFTQDFLYQVEWQRYVKEGLLSNISLAFSRDQKDKIYVQHRIIEEGEQVYQWLQDGAHVYVCGDANHMAKDVHEALIQVVQTHGGKSREAAELYVNDLRRNKRYQKDVY